MRKLLRCVLVSAVTFSVIGRGQQNGNGNGSGTTQSEALILSASTNTSVIRADPPTGDNATCPSRTANYITHTLPQQCLRTDRGHAKGTQSSRLDQSSTTDGSSTSRHASAFADTGLSIGVTEAPSLATGSTAQEALNIPPSSPDGTVSTSAIGSTTLSEDEAETDSPLDKAKFLSFEEWKKQAIANYPEQGGNFRERTDRQRPGINNALEGYGEDGEIELDFSGFGTTSDGPKEHRKTSGVAEDRLAPHSAPDSPTARSKDAGKTCKERTNYASFDCAATMLKNNPECKSASSVLVENKDSYMLNTCAARNKFFIVELCDLILVDTVVLANYEFFSSIFRHFRVSVSDTYPIKMEKWIELGTFEARNTREVQAFLIEHSKIWARYLRIEFLTHYGSEYYCPISLLRVHGTTMLEEIRAQDESAAGDGGEEANLETRVLAAPTIAQEPAKSTDEPVQNTLQAIETTIGGIMDKPESSDKAFTVNASSTVSASGGEIKQATTSSPDQHTSDSTMSSNRPASANTTFETLPGSATQDSASNTTVTALSTTKSADRTDLRSAAPPNSDTIESLRSDLLIASSRMEISNSSSKAPVSSHPGDDAKIQKQASTTAASEAFLESLLPSTSAEALSASSSDLSDSSRMAPSSSTVLSSSTAPSTSTAPAQPQPSTQESFFKTIYKRLQQLESNSTLSLQYIEEQSRILRDAFAKVEKRQISATTSFLTNLNETVMHELRGFRQEYDQLWQSTVIELAGQREQYQREMLALSSRLTLLADELVWQKRMGIVQSTLLLLCLGLVLFARGGTTGYLEVPIMQQVMNRSTAALSRGGWETPPASPSPESRSPVALFRRKIWRSATEPSVANAADDPMSGTDSRPQSKEGAETNVPPLDVTVEPPTPPRGSEESAENTWNDTDNDEVETLDAG